MEQGFAIWFSGPPFTGKAFIAELLEEKLLDRGVKVESLANAENRKILREGLDTTLEGEEAWIEREGLVANMLTRNGIIAICSSIAPFRLADAERPEIGDFIEVYFKSSLDELLRRSSNDKEVKRLFESYGPPEEPEVILEIDSNEPSQLVSLILKTLEVMEQIPKVEGEDYSEEDEAAVKKRLKDLGYI